MRRLRGKQPAPKQSAETGLVKVFGFLAEALGLNVFRIAAVSRACWRCLGSDASFWKEVLGQSISLFQFEDKDGASKSIFARIPADLWSLDLQLGDVEWFYCGKREVSADALKLLAGKLGSLKSLLLRLFHHDDKEDPGKNAKEELMKSLPSTLTCLSLTMDMEDWVMEALAAHMPPKLQSFEIDFKLSLKGSVCKLLEALPSSLECLKLWLGEVLEDENMPQLTSLVKANQGLKTLSLGMENCQLSGENIAMLIGNIPAGLHCLQLKMADLDLTHADVCPAFAEVFAKLGSLRVLSLDFENSRVGTMSQLFEALSMELFQCSLNFGACHLTPLSLSSLAHMLTRQPILERLDLDLRATNVTGQAEQIFRNLPGSIRNLALGFFNSNLRGEAFDILSASLPKNLQSLKLDVNGCTPWTRKHLEKFFSSLPRSLVKLELDAEWRTLCRLRQITFSCPLKALSLHSDSLQAPCDGQLFLEAWAAAIQTLNLQSLQMWLELCDVSLQSAQHLAERLPLRSLQELSLDLDGVVDATDTVQRWEEVLGPLVSKFGSRVRLPTESPSSSESRERLGELFAAFAQAN